ncbi:MAG: nitroreductase family protein [Oscillospiraceae bacterium]|nr:nitroreductase family protein [Oscillospiraceae bacterium]
MTIFEAIKVRRSVRKFKDSPIPDDIINEMLEAARLSPSGGNAQGYVFGVIRDRELKLQLAKAAGNQIWIATAPVVFACCADISWDIADSSEDDFGLIVNNLRFGKDFINYLNGYPNRKECMTLFANATPLIPAEHIFLTAVLHGLSACFIGYLDVKKASEILNLPEQLSCLFLLPVGYADEIPGEKNLKSIDEISFYDKWKDEY